LADVAELEKALAHALDAPDAPTGPAPRGQPLTRAALLALPPVEWPSIELALAPHAQLASAGHDLERIAALCAEGRREDALELRREAQPLPHLVGRRGHRVYVRRLRRIEAAALERVAGGARFAVLCEDASRHGATAEQITEHLMRWVDDGVLIRPGVSIARGQAEEAP
jgi:hypothetical protein